MKTATYVSILVILNMLLATISGSMTLAGQEGLDYGRGQGSTHMSNKGAGNSNAQWSADPNRGWVRADERHKVNDQREPSNSSKGNHAKTKAGAKNKKSF